MCEYCCCYIEDNSTFDLFQNLFAPVIVAIIVYIFLGRLGEYKKRRNDSKLGVAILNTLIEEVENGYNSLNATINMNKEPLKLPHKSWYGITTISDDVLLRIIAVSSKAEVKGFPIEQIKSHTKNYFDHMIPNWEKIVIKYYEAKQNNQKYPINSTYDKAAKGVLDMLNNACELLKANSKRILPK